MFVNIAIYELVCQQNVYKYTRECGVIRKYIFILFYKLAFKSATISSAESRQQLKPDLGIKPSPPAIINGFSFKIMAFGQPSYGLKVWENFQRRHFVDIGSGHDGYICL